MSAEPVFRHDDHRDEVVERWGKRAWSNSTSWWSNLDAIGRDAFLAEGVALKTDYLAARDGGLTPMDDAVSTIVHRHREWIAMGWGGVTPSNEQFIGLGQMYVTDERFARHYGGIDGATFVRDAIVAWVSAHSS